MNWSAHSLGNKEERPDAINERSQKMTILHAALITPLSGPLALYGKTGATALTLWARKAAKLPPPWTQVELEVHDSVLSELINVANAPRNISPSDLRQDEKRYGTESF